MTKKIGSQSVKFRNKITIKSTASVVGPKEGEGPLGKYFDVILEDHLAGESTWEKAESRIANKALKLAIEKSGYEQTDIDYILSGDLLNQNSGSTFGIRDLELPFFGLFGACSTFGEAMGLASMIIDGDFADKILIGASSHFCAAEKQFRLPLELGVQRPLTTTWTVTGDGTAILEKEGLGPYITEITTGKIIDFGITDMNNMGAAMAPSAADTILAHLKDFDRSPDYYDVIATGDLGHVGHSLAIQLMKEDGFDISKNYTDCGIEIFDQKTQDTHSGGSGCACSAVTFSSYFYPKIKSGEIKRMLFVPTGALVSSTSALQGESIPGISHAVVIEHATM